MTDEEKDIEMGTEDKTQKGNGKDTDVLVADEKYIHISIVDGTINMDSHGVDLIFSHVILSTAMNMIQKRLMEQSTLSIVPPDLPMSNLRHFPKGGRKNN